MAHCGSCQALQHTLHLFKSDHVTSHDNVPSCRPLCHNTAHIGLHIMSCEITPCPSWADPLAHGTTGDLSASAHICGYAYMHSDTHPHTSQYMHVGMHARIHVTHVLACIFASRLYMLTHVSPPVAIYARAGLGRRFSRLPTLLLLLLPQHTFGLCQPPAALRLHGRDGEHVPLPLRGELRGGLRHAPTPNLHRLRHDSHVMGVHKTRRQRLMPPDVQAGQLQSRGSLP